MLKSISKATPPNYKKIFWHKNSGNRKDLKAKYFQIEFSGLEVSKWSSNILFKLQIFSLIAAFLAFMALGVKYLWLGMIMQ